MREVRGMRKAAIICLIAIGSAPIGAPVRGATAGAPANTSPVKVTCFDGAWSSKTTYGPGVVVSYNGANYMSLVTNTNDSPLSSFADWSILDATASKGPACPQGPLTTTGGTAPATGGSTATKPPVIPGPPGTPTTAPKPPNPFAPVAPGGPNGPAATSNSPSPTRTPAAPTGAAQPQATIVNMVSIYDSPAMPDVGGHSVLGGILTGRGFTAILPNLKVCARPNGASRFAEVCTEICKPGHQCLNQRLGCGLVMPAGQSTFTAEVFDYENPDAKTNVLSFNDPDSRHKIVSFNMNPANCAISGDASTSAQCKIPANNPQQPSLNGVVQIGFGTCMAPKSKALAAAAACTKEASEAADNAIPTSREVIGQLLGLGSCRTPNSPLDGSFRSPPGKHFVFPSNNAEVWTHVCQGRRTDGILFKLFGGQIQPQNPQITGQCDATTAHVIQFINPQVRCLDGTNTCLQGVTYCPDGKQGYFVTGGGKKVCRDYGNQWYSDHGAFGNPNLTPEVLCSGSACWSNAATACPAMAARMVVDQPDVVIEVDGRTPKGLAQIKSFVDFVMCGSTVTGVVRWTRTSIEGNAPVYDVEEGPLTDTAKMSALKQEICRGSDLADVGGAPYTGDNYYAELKALKSHMNCTAL
jgi:hypothetical protein